MPAPIANSMLCKACLACFAFVVLSNGAANSAEPSASIKTLCAEKETLLGTLVEAHGQVPNVASAKLAEAGILIMQARAACDDGRADDAAALYDRITAYIELPLPAISKIDPER
jgi:hypothetical protein